MKIHSEQEMINYGKKIAENCIAKLPSTKVIEIIGDVGAGKTTLTKGIALALGLKTEITSPSFTISKTYAIDSKKKLIHYDFYRLKDPGLMVDDLAENLANPDNIIIIEWGESIADLLPKNRLIIKIDYNNDGTREITLKKK